MTASIPSYMEYAAKLRAALPKDVVAVLDKYEAKGEYDAPEYQEAMIGRSTASTSAASTRGPIRSSARSSTSRRRSTTRCRAPTSSSSPATSRTGTAGTTCRRSACRPFARRVAASVDARKASTASQSGSQVSLCAVSGCPALTESGHQSAQDSARTESPRTTRSRALARRGVIGPRHRGRCTAVEVQLAHLALLRLHRVERRPSSRSRGTLR